jgi:hypothetical protein
MMKVPLDHMVAYHNIEKMGRLLVEGESCRVFTNKPVKDLIGKTVWTFTGAGRPRKYSLASVFEIEKVGETGDSGLRNFVAGPGHCFQPPLTLNDLDWFGALLKKVGRFRFGLQALDDPELARHLEELRREACTRPVDGPHVRSPALPTDVGIASPEAIASGNGSKLIKVITIRQPWVDHIFYGAKWCENRAWKTGYRGPLYVHSAANWASGVRRCSPGPGTTSAIVGCVQLVDVIDLTVAGLEGVKAAARRYGLRLDSVSLEHVEGSQCWIITQPRLLQKAIPQKGNQKIWNWSASPGQLELVSTGAPG